LHAELATFTHQEQEVVMEMLTSWEKKGRAEGLREGQQMLLERQLTRKFGPLPDGVRTRLERLPLPQLTALGEAMFDIDTLDELAAWLAAADTPDTDTEA
jgi:predicted transposase YdaD